MVELTLPDVPPAQGAGDPARRLAERVVAWQHRQPLARRIGPGEVAGWGVIALPYGDAPLFHQPSLLPGLSHRALVDFAARHAVDQRPGPADWPQRDIERADASAEPAPKTRYLLTAAISEPRSATPRRLLLAPAGPAIWGRRPPDRARLAVAALLGVAGVVLAVWGLVRVVHPAPAASEAVPASAEAASALPPAPPASAPSRAPAIAAASSAMVAVPASAPVALPPAALVPASAPAMSMRAAVAPASSPASARAAATVAPAPSPAAPVVPPPRLLPMPARGASAEAPVAASSPASATAPLPAGPHFALVSMPARKRAEAEATLQQVRQLLGPAIGTLQAQVMPSPQGFVVTLWPLPSQADAEHLAQVLARRGVPMKWMEF